MAIDCSRIMRMSPEIEREKKVNYCYEFFAAGAVR